MCAPRLPHACRGQYILPLGGGYCLQYKIPFVSPILHRIVGLSLSFVQELVAAGFLSLVFVGLTKDCV
jgi:hypothetical protein